MVKEVFKCEICGEVYDDRMDASICETEDQEREAE